jgi:hypothetical protein
MATPASPPTSTEPPSSSMAQKLELASKVAAAGAFLVYGCGFLITSLYHAKYGITQTNPFRPRIFSAGAWFLLFASIPIGFALSFRGNNRVPWVKVGQYLFPYWAGCTSMSIFPAALFTFSESPMGEPFKAWRIIVLVVALGITTALQLVKGMPEKLSALLSVILVAFFVQSFVRDLFVERHFTYGSIILWFFALGVLTIIEMNTYDRSDVIDGSTVRRVFAVLATIFIFATAYYPNMKTAWGGGAPVPVTVYFTKDSAIRPGQNVSALLLDESDAGIYLLGPKDKRAVFIPRGSIALVYFSDNLTDSDLLQHK